MPQSLFERTKPVDKPYRHIQRWVLRISFRTRPDAGCRGEDLFNVFLKRDRDIITPNVEGLGYLPEVAIEPPGIGSVRLKRLNRYLCTRPNSTDWHSLFEVLPQKCERRYRSLNCLRSTIKSLLSLHLNAVS